MYDITCCVFCADYDKLYEAKLTRTLKKFTPKPITQVHLLVHITQVHLLVHPTNPCRGSCKIHVVTRGHCVKGKKL